MNGFLLTQMTLRPLMQSGFTRTLVTAIVALQIVACGGGSGGDDAASATSTDSAISSQTTSASLTGSKAGESIAPATINTGSVSLSWTAPVTRADGAPLSLADIGGFYIYYGESEGSYPNRVELDDGAAQAVTLNDIPVGAYYMVMTTYDVNGHESGYSPVVKKTVL
jgi:hypothetical protein